jgi:hypothetical protein
MKKIAIGLVLALTLGIGATAVPQAAFSATPAGNVIAQDTRDLLSVTATAPNALSVKTTPGSKVGIKATGAKKYVTKKADTQGMATFNKLTAGSTYQIVANGERTTAMAVSPVSPASNLTVSTTATPDSVHMNWKHNTQKSQGPVSYRVSATPVQQGKSDLTKAVTNTVTTLETTLTGLNPTLLFEFSVTPINALGEGRATVALMARSLNEINGINPASPSEKPVVLTPKPAAISPATPAPAPAPAPAPVGPTTKTIYVCPDGFADLSGVCTKSTPYTFTTQDYTYHQESRIEACSGGDCPGSTYVVVPAPCSIGTQHGDTCQYWTTGQKQVSVSVKDSAPAGYTDNGSAWSKKDAMPAGYSDNGSEWVTTTGKVEKVVPA